MLAAMRGLDSVNIKLVGVNPRFSLIFRLELCFLFYSNSDKSWIRSSRAALLPGRRIP